MDCTVYGYVQSDGGYVVTDNKEGLEVLYKVWQRCDQLSLTWEDLRFSIMTLLIR